MTVTIADAILTVIKSAVPMDVAVYGAIVPSVPPARYVMTYIPPGDRSSETVDAVSDCVSVDFQVTSVASSSDPSYADAMCRWLVTTIQNALIDATVTADGLSPARITQPKGGSQAPRPDEATPDKKVYAVDRFHLETVRLS